MGPWAVKDEVALHINGGQGAAVSGGGDPPTSFLLGLLAAPCKERGVQLLRTASGTTARIRRRFSSPRKRTPLRFDQLAVLNKPLHTAPTHPHAPPPPGGCAEGRP